jgi:hypothetical protein
MAAALDGARALPKGECPGGGKGSGALRRWGTASNGGARGAEQRRTEALGRCLHLS